MEKDTGIMLKKVIVYDLIIMIIALIASIISFREYALILAVGIVLALTNFILNAVIANYALTKGGGSTYPVAGAIARVAVTAGAAVLLCGDAPGNYIAFIVGYSLHYISIILYGIALGRKPK